jgi:Nucleotidyl transferase AbiEii toxin, Type IV TA system
VAESQKNIFELLFEVSELLLVGGHALQAHGVVRQTVDVDCLVPDVRASSLEEILRSAGFTRLARTENFSRFRHPTLGHVDVLFVDSPTFDQLSRQSLPYKVGNATLRVPSLDHLIALKLHAIKNDPARELRDLSDIVDMVKRNSFSGDELRRLCMRFGPAGIWDKVRIYV